MKKSYLITAILILVQLNFYAQETLISSDAGFTFEGNGNPGGTWSSAENQLKIGGTADSKYGRNMYYNFDITSLNSLTLNSAKFKIYNTSNNKENITGDRIISINAISDGTAGTSLPIVSGTWATDFYAGRTVDMSIATYTYSGGASVDTYFEFDILTYLDNMKASNITEICFEVTVQSDAQAGTSDETYFTFGSETHSSHPGNIEYEVPSANVSRVSNIETMVFPNPAKNEVQITSEAKLSKISIFNISGKLLSEKNISSKNNKVDISSFSNGIYIIELIDIYGNKACHRLIKN